MSEPKRYYRKSLTSDGLIYIAGEEVEMVVKNLSITGSLAEIGDDAPIHSIEELFEVISVSPKVDIYLPEMRLMGEAEVARAEFVDGRLHLALQFTHITHDVDNTLYVRHAYRKDIVAPGQIVFDKKKYQFTTRNVSVTGLMVHLNEKLDIAKGTETIFDFKLLKLRGKIKVAWVEAAEDGGTYMGLEYMHMEKTDIKGIPRFAPVKKLPRKL